MKYGRLVYDARNKEKCIYNIGDYFQTFAVDEYYKSKGIKCSDIIEINRRDVASYHGEKIVLVMNGVFNPLSKKDFFPISPDIIPIYVGINRTDAHNINQNDFFDKIVGCRDEKSYEVLSSKGINAFLSGCLTITMGKNTDDSERDTIFFVDIPQKLIEHIPQELLKEKCEFMTQEIETNEPEKVALERLELYRRKAKLIITSRLHCASPCLGMGIPVILARDYFDHRYGWIDKYMPLYERKNFHCIDWSGTVFDTNDIKRDLYDWLDIQFLNVFKNSEIDSEVSERIHNYYIDREKNDYYVPWLTKAYWFILRYNPKFAEFVRTRLLRRFSVLSARK